MKTCSLILFLCCFIATFSYAQTGDRTKVALRMIGHQLLLTEGDSSSRVLPVLKEWNRYQIQFEAPFAFQPDELSSIISHVMDSAKISNHYLVEVVHCKSEDVVYSFEVNQAENYSLVPCSGRGQPEGRYTIYISLLETSIAFDAYQPAFGEISVTSKASVSSKPVVVPWLLLPVVFLLGFIVFWRKRIGQSARTATQLQSIGQYRFDRDRMVLKHKDRIIELSGKESALLTLLYEHVNTTVERKTILQEVWADDGDYIGRTLDVYISKLRKKFEADPEVKIVNIRGVGYRLLLEA